MRTFNVTEFALQLGVSVKTLQRWDRDGKLKPLRTPSNRRIYTQDHLTLALGLTNDQQAPTIVYLRVADQAQRGDLARQRAALETFCIAQGLTVDEWVVEFGEGLSLARPRLLELIERIIAREIGRLVIAHPDRLARFGHELIAHLCALHGCELLVLNSEALSPDLELAQDLQTIVQRYSTRLPELQMYRDALRRSVSRTLPQDDPSLQPA